MPQDANLLRRGQTFLSGKKKAAEAVTVTLTRGPHTTTGVSACVGSQLLRTRRGDGEAKTERTDQDFFILFTDYLINGAQVAPEKGDGIIYNGYRYKVLPYSEVDEKQDASCGFGITWRIHTRRIGTE